MSSEAQDPFTKIHDLLRIGELSAALALLLDANTKQINYVFRFDRNHAWYCIGDIYYRQRQFNEAKNAFKRAIRTRPDDVEGLVAIGNCYDELDKPKFAERYFMRALNVPALEKNGDQQYEITLNLANALFDQGRMAEAIELYKKLKDAPVLVKSKAEKNLALAENSIRL